MSAGFYQRKLSRTVVQYALPEGACDSQPIARGSMDWAVSMPQNVRNRTTVRPAGYTGRPVKTLRARHPPPAVTSGAPPPPPGNSRCESTQHTTPHNCFTRASAMAVAVPRCLTSQKRRTQYSPSLCPTNALSKEPFHSDRKFDLVPNGVSNEHSCSDCIFGGRYCSLDTGGGGVQ